MSNISCISVSPSMKQRNIISKSIILVPYKPFHVPKYNSWMQNEELQYLTGSEPLNLEEEFNMYESWTIDSNKCTFIILDRSLYESLTDAQNEEERQVSAMIGDVNFYILDPENSVSEIEIMIAETFSRNKGFGKEAVVVMMKFASEIVGVKIFEAKIKIRNQKSIGLFANLGFQEKSRSDIFEEITFVSELNMNQKLLELFEKTKIDYKVL